MQGKIKFDLDYDIPSDLLDIVSAICEVGADVAGIVARGPLGQALGAAVGENTDGDSQKALDVLADEMFVARLKACSVKWFASEERDEINEIKTDGQYAVAMDPLDGSSNIDVNVSIGTIFSIFEATDDAEGSFLRLADQQLVGGYLIYGPQTGLVITFGAGTHYYVLDREAGEFRLVEKAVRIAPQAAEFAINASNYRHWSAPVRAYVDDCVAGITGPLEKNFNMRWVASLVAETHRILMRGGIFLYPSDERPGYEHGRLRMVYECAPIAFLIEQAGGAASDGYNRILNKTAEGLHVRTPFIFGTAEKVNRVATYHDLPEEEISGLFSSRGLFRK
jgi:fructose-1,6-bisphosphatase I